MIRAVEGMVVEQNSIVLHFNLTIFFLGFNLIGTYGIMMTFPAAVACTVITVVGMCLWYQATSRIFNRFRYTVPSLVNNDLSADSDDDSLYASDGRYNEISQKVTDGYLLMLDQFTSNISHIKLNAARGTNIKINSKNWVRKYFVLKKGCLLYYNDQDSYKIEGDRPINKRPILLYNYMLGDETDFDIYNSNEEIVFKIILKPKGTDDFDQSRIWIFQCDTRLEYLMWKEAFNLATNKLNIDTGSSDPMVSSTKSDKQLTIKRR